MPPSGYTGGVDLAPSELTGGRTAADLQKGQLLQSAKELETGAGRSAEQLVKTYGVQPGTEPGYLDLIKKAGSLENVPLSERFSAVQQLGGKAIEEPYYVLGQCFTVFYFSYFLIILPLISFLECKIKIKKDNLTNEY